MADLTKKLVLLVSDAIMNGTSRNLNGSDLHKIFEAYGQIKGSGVLHSLGQEGVPDSTPNASYIEISQSMFDYIGNKLVIERGMVAFESKLNVDQAKGVTILCCSYSEFIEYAGEFDRKLRERQERTVNVLNELGEERILVTNLIRGICDPIRSLLGDDSCDEPSL